MDAAIVDSVVDRALGTLNAGAAVAREKDPEKQTAAFKKFFAADVADCAKALAKVLGEKNFFVGGDTPTLADVFVYDFFANLLGSRVSKAGTPLDVWLASLGPVGKLVVRVGELPKIKAWNDKSTAAEAKAAEAAAAEAKAAEAKA